MRRRHRKFPRRPVNLTATQTVAQTLPAPSTPTTGERARAGAPGVASRRHAPTQRIQTRSWYRIENSASAGLTAVYIYDEIGMWGVNAADFMDALRQVSGNIELHLNSPGGDVFDGIAIFNCLRAHSGRVDVVIDSLAASAASVIAQAGDTVTMMPGSQMMIHDAAGLCMGNAEDMAQMAAMLDQQSDNIAGIYAAAAGGTREEWRERMRAETWYMAEEAVAAGLADGIHATEEDEDAAGSPQPRQAGRAPRNHAAPAVRGAPAPAAPPAPAGDDPHHPPAAEPQPEREPLPEFDINIADLFATVTAPPPPDPVEQGWDWTAVRGGVTALMTSAPAARERPAPTPPPAVPAITFDRAAFRNALRNGGAL